MPVSPSACSVCTGGRNMKRILVIMGAATFLTTLVVVANAGSSIVITGGGGSGMSQTQADQRYLRNDAGVLTPSGGDIAGHLGVDGGATINNGLSVGGVSGTITHLAANIAPGKTTAQSTTYSDYYSSKAVDDDLGTFSTTNSAAIGEWLAIDLGSLRIVREMVLYKQTPYTDRPANFRIQTADDWAFLNNVRTVVVVTSATDNVTTVTFPTPTAGRYWRILTTQPEYIAIREWRVYESLAGPLVTINGNVATNGNTTTVGSAYASNLYVDGGVSVHTSVTVGTDTGTAEPLRVTGNSSGMIRAQYDTGGTAPPPGLLLVNTTASTSQYAPPLVWSGSNGRCHRLFQIGVDLYLQGKSAPCDSGAWTNIVSFSTYGQTWFKTLYADADILNDGSGNSGNVFVNDGLRVNGQVEWSGSNGTVAILPACDRPMIVSYARDGNTTSVCRCAKNAGAWAWDAVGAGNCTPP